ncbi:MAG: metallophosphatase family protein [Caldilinea sp.]|nr:metallophosphoesterase family protein [Caldilinea sp.]MCB0038906.1 metallophosphoesterase family protein [Caldilinea sp.]MCB0146139.1 metallophosphoesterase family protein [Caldilineaceae bacterium]MCO5211740.1 metallophosphatase family protein [Caldilinea sp.]MCW5842057.1 metallophosphoesterase family protein [Caldilinea sp.]
MRIALFSDTHGNLPATEAALAAIARARPDQVICLGDVAMFGPQPRETLAAIAALGCPVVMGNTDAWALDPAPTPDADENTVFYETVEAWCAAQLTATDKAQLRAFRPAIAVDLGDGNTLLCYHGSPRSFHEAVRAESSDEELDAIFADEPAILCAGGHTHTAMVRRHRHRLVVNPGSVGLPFALRRDGMAYNPPWAEYALIDYRSPADVAVTLCRAPVDVAQIVQVTLASDMPMADRWLADWSSP